jgi:alpha-D-ribose 1-methylphosphonate 5-triphosphate diphosphatase
MQERAHAAASTRLILTGGMVVTRDLVIDGGSVIIEGERIVEVSSATYPVAHSADETVVDVTGRLVLPGIVCLHNDGHERAINPRPKADFPRDFALLTYDRALASAGITTQFHAVSFLTLAAKDRTVSGAVQMSHDIHAFAASGYGSLDHYVQFRCDVRQPDSLESILACVEDAPVRMVSMNDHVPGQGQYRNIGKYLEQVKPYLPASMGTDDAGMAAWLAERERFKQETDHTVEWMYSRLAAEARARGFTLISHDDDSAEKVEVMHGLGCRMAEFPVAVEAAERARELGMHVSVGAPNIVRGGSLTGNASGLELAARGLVDILIADYHAPSMLMAALRLHEAGIATLPDAVAMIGANAADAANLPDRGMLAPGLRADVIVVDRIGAVPVVTQHIVAGTTRFQASTAGHRTVGPVPLLM